MWNKNWAGVLKVLQLTCAMRMCRHFFVGPMWKVICCKAIPSTRHKVWAHKASSRTDYAKTGGPSNLSVASNSVDFVEPLSWVETETFDPHGTYGRGFAFLWQLRMKTTPNKWQCSSTSTERGWNNGAHTCRKCSNGSEGELETTP